MRGRKLNINDAEDAQILSDPELMKPMGAEDSPFLHPISTEASGEGTGKAKLLSGMGSEGEVKDEFDSFEEIPKPAEKLNSSKPKTKQSTNPPISESDINNGLGEDNIEDFDFPDPPEYMPDEKDTFDEEYDETEEIDGDAELTKDYLDKEIPKQAKFLTDLVTNLVETLIFQKNAIDVDGIRMSLMEIPDMHHRIPDIVAGLNQYNAGFRSAFEFTKDEKKLIVTALVNILKKYPEISDKITGEAQLGLAVLTIGLTKLGIIKQFRDKGTEILLNINETVNQYREYFKAKTEQMRAEQDAQKHNENQSSSQDNKDDKNGKYG